MTGNKDSGVKEKDVTRRVSWRQRLWRLPRGEKKTLNLSAVIAVFLTLTQILVYLNSVLSEKKWGNLFSETLHSLMSRKTAVCVVLQKGDKELP